MYRDKDKDLYVVRISTCNSRMVVPKPLMNAIGLQPGMLVAVRRDGDSDRLIIERLKGLEENEQK